MGTAMFNDNSSRDNGGAGYDITGAGGSAMGNTGSGNTGGFNTFP